MDFRNFFEKFISISGRLMLYASRLAWAAAFILLLRFAFRNSLVQRADSQGFSTIITKLSDPLINLLPGFGALPVPRILMDAFIFGFLALVLLVIGNNLNSYCVWLEARRRSRQARKVNKPRVISRISQPQFDPTRKPKVFVQEVNEVVPDEIEVPDFERSGKTVLDSDDRGTQEREDPVNPAESEEERQRLLKLKRDIEKSLNTAKRQKCAFLSIDVVQSTKLKEGEDDLLVNESFHAYGEMVRSILGRHDVWKLAWTPDGVMSCFLELELAVSAAKSLLIALKNFNEVENRLRHPFQIRCGINSGEVSIFHDSKLETVVNRVIDTAGHLQKACSPDSLWVSESSYLKLSDQSDFERMDTVVDDEPVYSWTPRSNSLAR